jgi:hypothetical protein
MKILLILSAFVLSASAFAGCPESVVGSFKGNGNTITISGDAKNLTISIDGEAFTAPVNGQKTRAPLYDSPGVETSVALSCDGDKLIQKGYESDNKAIEIVSRYWVEGSNLLSDAPGTPDSLQKFARISN